MNIEDVNEWLDCSGEAQKRVFMDSGLFLALSRQLSVRLRTSLRADSRTEGVNLEPYEAVAYCADTLGETICRMKTGRKPKRRGDFPDLARFISYVKKTGRIQSVEGAKKDILGLYGDQVSNLPPEGKKGVRRTENTGALRVSVPDLPPEGKKEELKSRTLFVPYDHPRKEVSDGGDDEDPRDLFPSKDPSAFEELVAGYQLALLEDIVKSFEASLKKASAVEEYFILLREALMNDPAECFRFFLYKEEGTTEETGRRRKKKRHAGVRNFFMARLHDRFNQDTYNCTMGRLRKRFHTHLKESAEWRVLMESWA